MRVFHGTNQDFSAVDLAKSRDKRDFGRGFYTTTIRQQAEDWAESMARKYGGTGLYVYEFEAAFTAEVALKTFEGFTEEWFDFVMENRTRGGTAHPFDLVRGPVANDKTTRTIALYVEGVYDKQEAIRRLRYMQANDQVSFHTEKAVSCLTLVDKKKVAPDRVTYRGVDITFDLMVKTEHVVRIIAETEGRGFDEAYQDFVASRTYGALQKADTLLWSESAAFLADEYYRETPP
jgi:hypothetical protein